MSEPTGRMPSPHALGDQHQRVISAGAGATVLERFSFEDRPAAA